MSDSLTNQTLLELWRESSRGSQLELTAHSIATTMQRVLTFEQMTIRVIDSKHKQVFTLSESPANQHSSDQKRAISKIELDQLQRWCRSDRILRRGKRLTGTLGILLPEVDNRDVLAVPLHTETSDAALMLIASEGMEFSDTDAELALRLAEPIAMAVANHHRLHEIASLREAAEAEKGALLRRLGRTDLGDQIIGEHSGLKKVMERVQLVANSDAPVMILGETGSGKEVIARALHMKSTRSAGPFIRVNCGAIPSELIDSQLFGHEKGAFTGADQTRQGWFERADGGTLFLDEIGELPLEAQVRFLRVLQDGFVERVGSDKPIHVDVRVIAATHRDLAAMVSSGQFREDLWYRVAVFPVLLPPLRERKGDIPELAFHFAERAATRFGLSPVSPSAADIAQLQAYNWPGNIRELGAVMDRAAILGDGKSLEIAASLGSNRDSTNTRSAAPIPPTHNEASPSLPTESLPELADWSIDAVMKQHIERVLQRTNGRIEGPEGAAHILKINPHTLRARMRKLKIQWNRFRLIYGVSKDN